MESLFLTFASEHCGGPDVIQIHPEMSINTAVWRDLGYKLLAFDEVQTMQ